MTLAAQKFHALSEADSAQLAAQRAVVEKYLGNDPQNLENYATAAGKLGLLRAILDARLFGPTHTYELQCMGVVFGDVFVLVCGWEWSVVEDALGRDPCIRVPASTIVLYPLTLISKRIERGDDVDVFALFDEIAADTERLVQAVMPS